VVYDSKTGSLTGGTFFNGNTLRNFVIESASPVPEPESYALMLVGTGVLVWWTRKRAQSLNQACKPPSALASRRIS
jgi:hypothetical protein